MSGEVVKLDIATLHRALRKFEEAYAAQTGLHLSSSVFYERYKAGEIDSQFATAWATFYEAFERQTKSTDGSAEKVADALDALAVG